MREDDSNPVEPSAGAPGQAGGETRSVDAFPPPTPTGTADDGRGPWQTRMEIGEFPSTVELTILADGRVYARNLTASMAVILLELNPTDRTMRLRATGGQDLA